MLDHDLVSVVGDGGIGKSALALAAAQAWLQAAPPGAERQARWVALSDVDEADDLDAFIADAAGFTAMRPSAGEGLLVLDQGEHLADRVASWIADPRRRPADWRVLVTSQVRMGVAGERVLRLAPLGLPVTQDAEAIAASPAVQLLVQRVRALDRGFRVEPHGALAAEICRALDGLPLAIELAAAQVPVFGLSGVRERLDARLRLLRTTEAGRPARHRALQASFARSLALLPADDQRIFLALGVFAGGFELHALAPTLAPLGLDDWALAEALARLVDHSLVVADDRPGRTGRPRYRLRESVRAYARDAWRAPERHAVAQAHARWMNALFESENVVATGVLDDRLRDAFAPEIDNLQAALEHCFCDGGDRQLGIQLVGTAAELWPFCARPAEGRRWLERAEAATTSETPTAVQAAVCDGLGLLWQNGDPARALDAFRRATRAWQSIGSVRAVRSRLGEAWALVNLGREDECEQVLAETAPAVHGDGRLRAHHRTALGTLHQRRGRWEDARLAMEEALHWRQLLGHDRQALVLLLNLGDLACSAGDLPRALEQGRAAAREAERQGIADLLGRILGNLCTVHLGLGELDAAEDCARRAVPLLRADSALTWFADPLAWLAALQGRVGAAARLLGYADAAVQAGRITRQSAEQGVAETTRGLLAAAAPDAQVAEWAAQGGVMTEAQMVACAFLAM